MSKFSFGHLTTSSTTSGGGYKTTTRQYATQPFEYSQPEKGKEEHIVHCDRCGMDVKVTMLSNGEIWKKRLKWLPILPGFALLWFLLELPPSTTGFGNFVNKIEGILGVITFFAAAWSLGKILEDKNNLMFEIDSPRHAILWNKNK